MHKPRLIVAHCRYLAVLNGTILVSSSSGQELPSQRQNSHWGQHCLAAMNSPLDRLCTSGSSLAQTPTQRLASCVQLLQEGEWHKADIGEDTLASNIGTHELQVAFFFSLSYSSMSSAKSGTEHHPACCSNHILLLLLLLLVLLRHHLLLQSGWSS